MASFAVRGTLARLSVVAAALVAATLAPSAAAQTTARLSFHWGTDHESAIMSTKFANEVNRRSGGKLKIDVFPSGQLSTRSARSPARCRPDRSRSAAW